jgi:hypothetical protein
MPVSREWLPCELYQAWESAREDAERALADWRAAPAGGKLDGFAAYRAAADREDAAAFAWLRACEECDSGRLAEA